MKHSPYARPTKPLNSQMNVVPYIDVMLVLLVIFMVTAPMLTTGVQVDLPKEHTRPIETEAHLPVIVSIQADGSLFLSSQSAIDEPLEKQALLARLGELAKEQTDSDGNSTLQVFVNADSQNQYQTIMHIMAGLQQVGISKVGLLTEQTKPTK